MSHIILAILTLAGIAYGVSHMQAAHDSARTYGASRTVVHHAPITIRAIR